MPKTAIQIQEELNQQIEESLEEAELIIINGPDYDHTVELLSAADCVDGLVYVVKAGYDQMEITEEAICTLGFSKAKLLGYVIISSFRGQVATNARTTFSSHFCGNFGII